MHGRVIVSSSAPSNERGSRCPSENDRHNQPALERLTQVALRWLLEISWIIIGAAPCGSHAACRGYPLAKRRLPGAGNATASPHKISPTKLSHPQEYPNFSFLPSSSKSPFNGQSTHSNSTSLLARHVTDDQCWREHCHP
jgi:hypothetical protein